MRQFFGMSRRGDLAEAVRGLSNPQFIMLFSNNPQFEAHVKTLESLYPKIPSIGCIGMSYDTGMVETCCSTFAAAVTPSVNAMTPTPDSTTPVS